MKTIITLERLGLFLTEVKKLIETIVSSVKSGLKLTDISDVMATADEVNHLSGVKSGIQGQLEEKAPLASPAFTGTPTAPTATAGTKTEQVATTKFVDNAISNVKASISKVYTPKGSVQKFSELPTNASVGDVYDVKEKFEIDGEKYPAGTNVAWTDDGKWDPLGGKFDLSDYYNKAEIDNALKGKLGEDDLVEATDEEIRALFQV